MKLTFPANQQDAVSFKGWLYQGGRLVDSLEGASLFGQGDFGTFVDSVIASNGNFVVAVSREDELWAAVDRLRSIPLFYGQKDGRFYLSDDAYWVRQQVGVGSPSEIESAELCCLLYVLGNGTLASGVKQLRAGEALRVTRSLGGVSVEVRPYYCYLFQQVSSINEAELMARLDGILVTTFERMLKTIGDRQIVVPLSGGLDSRLITCMLKRLGVQNVLTFTYGLPGSREATISQYVASKVGYPWTCVSYLDWDWNDPECRRHRQSFYRFSANLCALPPILEDWYAVWVMKKRGLLADDAVFCPGHTVCFTAGSLATKASSDIRNMAELIELILRKHSPRLQWSQPSEEIMSGIRDHVRQALCGMQMMNRIPSWEPLDLHDCWNWNERQSKRIINMVRAYEYWGYEWRVPLWDSEIMDLWSLLPMALRRYRLVYRNYLRTYGDRHYFGLYDPSDGNLNASSPSGSRVGGFMHKALQRFSASRYFVADKNMERVVSGNYLSYLRQVGKRVLSREPVTAPWLLVESHGLHDIWTADGQTQDSIQGDDRSWPRS